MHRILLTAAALGGLTALTTFGAVAAPLAPAPLINSVHASPAPLAVIHVDDDWDRRDWDRRDWDRPRFERHHEEHRDEDRRRWRDYD